MRTCLARGAISVIRIKGINDMIKKQKIIIKNINKKDKMN